ncbi:MAG: glycosyltransferase, partial [Actinomycetota bacterium]
LVRTSPSLDPLLVVLGGPSGANGVQPDDLAKLAAELGVAGSLVLHAPVPHGHLPRYYRAADCVLIPSRSESFGLVALEAAACGTPVVATDVGGLRTTVRDGGTGRLVAGADPKAFARALDSILSSPEQAAGMGEAGAHFARRFDWRVAAAGLLDVYEEHAAEHLAMNGSDPCV